MSWLISALVFGLAVASDDALPTVKEQPKQEIILQAAPTDETERLEQTYPLTADGRISVSNINGPIIVEAWDRNEVKLVAVKTADTRENLKDLKIEINAQPNSLKIETDIEHEGNGNRVWNSGSKNQSGTWHNGKYYRILEVSYQLTVPRGARIDEVESVNGSITISNLTNYSKVSAVNGEVRASNLTGTANLSTVNGTVEADFSSLRAGSQISLSTVNGRANLTIPSDVNATIKAETVNGSIANDFGLPVRKGEYVGRDLYGRVGTGDIKIKLDSVNGGLNIRRRADGKTPSPVTNLLQSSAEQDWDDDEKAAAKKSRAATPRPKVKAAHDGTIIPRIKVDPIDTGDLNDAVRAGMDAARVGLEEANIALSGIKIDIDQKQIDKQIKDALRLQKDALAQMRELGWSPSAPFFEKKSQSFPVKGIPEIVVNGNQCAVTVRGWDKQEVRYSVLRVAPNRPNGKTIDEKVTHTESKVVINVEDDISNAHDGDDSNFNKMKIEVFVPRKSNLKIRTEGEIRLENISGKVELEGSDEAINVRDAEGTLSVRAVDARMRVIGFRGELDAEVSDGVMMLEGDFRRLNAQTSDGTIILSLPENANASFETNHQNIVAEGISLARQGNDENAFKWQIGSGSSNRGILNTSEDGKIIIRSIDRMMSR